VSSILIRLVMACSGILCLLAAAGCSTTRYKEAADKEVYSVLDEKRPLVAGMPDEFTISPQEAWNPLDGTPLSEQTPEALTQAEVDETGANVINLERALLIAVNQSRTYQNEKERLFLEGLGLTLDRHQYTPILNGGLSAVFERDTVEGSRSSDFSSTLSSARTVVTEIENITGTRQICFKSSLMLSSRLAPSRA
jgi:hypothetical protein